jgi:hypothetical protein
MSILIESAKFIGWLSGSLAGIVAILTACGYLITTANLHLLGLDLLFIDYGTEFYVRRGGNFIFFLVSVLMRRILLPLLVIAVPAAAGCFLIYLTVRHKSWFQRLGSLFTGPEKQSLVCSTACKVIVYIVLVALFAYQLTPLNISHVLYDKGPVLYDAGPAAGSQDEREMKMKEIKDINEKKEWIIQGNTVALSRHFLEILISVILAGALLSVALWVTAGFRVRILFVAPFAIMFLVYLLLLPRVYGVLMLPSEFAPVVIGTKEGIAGQESRLYLINKAGDDYVLWNAREKRLLRISKSEVKTVEIGRNRTILREPDSSSERTGT